MVRFYLVRHGQTVWNSRNLMQGRQDSPLTETGCAQAADAAAALRGVEFAAASGSPAGRARQTMRIILDALATRRQPEPVVCEDLAEIALGSWEGAEYNSTFSAEDARQRDNFWNQPHLFDRAATGGEDFAQVCGRALAALERIAGGQGGAGAANVLVVSHTVVIRSVLNHFCGREAAHFWAEPLLEPGSVSVLDWHGAQRAEVVSYAGCRGCPQLQ